MLVVDFYVEVSMNGINNFLGNSTGMYVKETIKALETIDCSAEAGYLNEILDIAEEVGMIYSAIQADRQRLEEHTVASFEEIHGDKWDAATDRISELGDKIEIGIVMENAERFIEKHRQDFTNALSL